MESLGVEGVPLNIHNASTDLKFLQGTNELGGQYADYTIHGREARVGLKPETDAFNVEDKETGDEDFSTE